MLGAAAVLVAMVGAGSLLSRGEGPAPAGTTTGDRGAAISPTPTTTSQGAESTEPGGQAGAQVASKLYSLIRRSSQDKASIQAAAGELTSCGNVASAARTFDAAERSRNVLVDRVQVLDLSELPEALRLVESLSRAWHLSALADAAFADAARYAPCDNGSTYLADATELSQQSHPHKNRAARLWNDLAGRYGLPSVVGSAL